jgi:hypothetical protein
MRLFFDLMKGEIVRSMGLPMESVKPIKFRWSPPRDMVASDFAAWSDPIHRTLIRRLEASRERRREAALSPGNDADYAAWVRECARGEKLVRVLTAHLSRVPFVFQIRSPQPAMNPATTNDAEPMSQKHHSQHLSAASISSILSHGTWQGSDTVRLTCTHRTAPVLRKAGVSDPVPLEEYEVPVTRCARGLLGIDHERLAKNHFPPAPAGDASLFIPGGIFAGDSKSPVDAGGIRENILQFRPGFQAALAADAEPELAALCEIPATRTFEITIDSHRKLRVQVCGFEDQALPSPSEPERWKPCKPSNVDVHAAVSALYMARDLRHFEQL